MTVTREPTYAERAKVTLPVGEHGNVAVRRIVISEEDARFANLRASIGGRGRGYITAGTYTGLYRRGRLWMSDTPDEMRDQYGIFRRFDTTGGRVLIHGLGLGTTVQFALSCERVEHIDVVEVDPDVIALVGPHYASDRVTIHQGDAYDFVWPRGTRWTTAWHDIWENISADNLDGMARLHRRFGGRVDYQESWCRTECQRQRRSGW